MEMEAKQEQEERASVDKRKRETENANRTSKQAELLTAKFAKQYDDLMKKRDATTDEKAYMWYQQQMTNVEG